MFHSVCIGSFNYLVKILNYKSVRKILSYDTFSLSYDNIFRTALLFAILPSFQDHISYKNITYDYRILLHDTTK